MAGHPLVNGIADLRRQPGTRRRVEREVELDGLATSSARVSAGALIGIDIELEAVSNGLVATGTVSVPWEGECRRCLDPVRSSTTTEVREIFEPRPVEGETYPLGDDTVDLEPMVRDAVLLALPLAPLCGPDCRGPAPDAFPTELEDEPDGGDEPLGEDDRESARDPRWAGLDELRFDSPGADG
ncbi:MAG TPA: YceD family protein [Acidimicrobiales bacterium]